MAVLPATPRLLLRELSPADLEDTAALLGDPEVMRFWPAPLTRAEAGAWIARQQERYARDGHGYWLALDRRTSEPVGQAGVLLCDVDGATEAGLGWILHRRFWRRGLATEAAAACRDWAFATADRARVIALVRPENEPSVAVARRLGMTPERRTTYAGLLHVVYTARRTEALETAEHRMGRMVIACYRPRPGKERDLLAVVREHIPVLRGQGLVTDRPATVMRAADGTLLEVFEWRSEAAVERAHADPVVRALWGRFEAAAEFVLLDDLAEARQRFAHFEPVDP